MEVSAKTGNYIVKLFHTIAKNLIINNEENDIVEFKIGNIAELKLPEVKENHINKKK